MRAWILVVGVAFAGGCGGQLGESRVQRPVSPPPREDLRVELLEKQGWFDRATSVEASAIDCGEVCRVGEEICSLADRICEIAAEHPDDDEAQTLCEEARDRCERARRHVASSRCACRY